MEVLAGLGEHAIPFAVDVVALFKDPHGHVRVAAVLAIQGLGKRAAPFASEVVELFTEDNKDRSGTQVALVPPH